MRVLITVAIVGATACTSHGGHNIGSWVEIAPLDEARFEGPAIALRGKVYYFGGITDECPAGTCTVERVDVYDPATATWSATTPLPAGAPRHHISLAVVDQLIYVVGGFDGILGTAYPFTPFASTWSFDGTTWMRLADSPMARGAATAQVIDGKIYVAGGGITEPSALDMLTVYDPATNAWQTLAPMPTAREHVASCVLDGKLVVIGGWLADKGVSAKVEAYDPASDAWSTLDPLPTARGGLGAVVVGGECYAIGGEEWAGPDPGTFALVDGLVPQGAWTSFAPLPHARHGMGIAEVGGAIFAIGGGPTRGNSYTTEADRFTP
jgi:N-acetylneuraminic acid mutarotase